MSFFYSIILKCVSVWDAEKIHVVFIRVLRTLGIFARNKFLNRPLKIIVAGGLRLQPRNEISLFGLHFKNRVGLAAGMDKNGEALEGFALLDFSFLEIGTVTPLGQSGNPQPRLFRNYRDQVIFNAMGFNNLGCDAFLHEVLIARPHLPKDLILGINIGKNATTPLENASRDYATCVRKLHEVADYFTVNISSPNTQGLRGLQNFEALAAILTSVFNETEKLSKPRPILVKLAPEISEPDLRELVLKIERDFPIAGWIITNTLARDCPWKESAMAKGGLSGRPLIEASRESLVCLKKISKKPLVSSGGILTVEEAKLRFEMGASLVQLYSGLVFRGPRLIRQIVQLPEIN